jgi:hypothetical protein
MTRLPLVTQRRDIDVRVVFGQSIFELYQQIQNLLQLEAPALRHFFAEPIVNAVRGEIGWNTRASGPVRSAVELTDEEWIAVSNTLKRNSSLVKELIGRLEKSGRGRSAGIEALRGMLMTPDLRGSLFLVGEELVLAQWGCYEFGADARSADLFEQIDRKTNAVTAQQFSEKIDSQDPPPEKTDEGLRQLAAAEDTEAPDPQPSIQPPPDAEQLATNPDPRRRYWRWLVLLLLLLLLLLGLLWKYWHIQDSGSETALRAEISELWKKVAKKAKDCGLAPSPASDASAPQAPVTNQEFRERQTENRINPDTKVNVSLAWNDRADLDLYVKQPDGQLVYFTPCQAPTCGTLDVDANRCDPRFPCTNLRDRPLENISWRNQMVSGRYAVYVGMYSSNRPVGEPRPVSFTVQVTQDGKSKTYQGVFRREEMKCSDRCASEARLIAEFVVE